MDKPGGVFLRRADLMPEEDRYLLLTVARAVLVGEPRHARAAARPPRREEPLPPLLDSPGPAPEARREAPTARTRPREPSTSSTASAASPPTGAST